MRTITAKQWCETVMCRTVDDRIIPNELVTAAGEVSRQRVKGVNCLFSSFNWKGRRNYLACKLDLEDVFRVWEVLGCKTNVFGFPGFLTPKRGTKRYCFRVEVKLSLSLEASFVQTSWKLRVEDETLKIIVAPLASRLPGLKEDHHWSSYGFDLQLTSRLCSICAQLTIFSVSFQTRI